VLENRRVDVVSGADVNPAHELDELARFGHIVAAGLVQSFANEVEGHFFITFPYFRYD
jgi:hypothetical protein